MCWLGAYHHLPSAVKRVASVLLIDQAFEHLITPSRGLRFTLCVYRTARHTGQQALALLRHIDVNTDLAAPRQNDFTRVVKLLEDFAQSAVNETFAEIKYGSDGRFCVLQLYRSQSQPSRDHEQETMNSPTQCPP